MKDKIKKHTIIVAGSFDQAEELAIKYKLLQFSWIPDFTEINVWGKVDGFHKNNTVIWLGDNATFHKNYLYCQYLAESFEINVYDFRGEAFNPFIIEKETTVH